MKIFLTGGTGFIGAALVRAMRRRNWEVRALVRDPHGKPAQWLQSQGVAVAAGDVTQSASLRDLVSGTDVVMHNAGVYELGVNRAAAERMRAVNVEGTKHVLAAALEAGVPRCVYVSTVWALGPSGWLPAPSLVKDETQRPSGAYLTAYEKSKAEAHQVALEYRAKGLPLIIVMPNAVMGANDHSALGYFLRLYLLGALPPIAWGADAVIGFVDVDALADGICLAAEKAPIGEDYVFSGEAMSVRDLFGCWSRYPGHVQWRIFLPRPLIRLPMALMEPMLRSLDLPAFMSRDTVDVTRAHLNYTSAKAQRDLGWSHPDVQTMWDGIVGRERELMGRRKGFLNRLRHQAVVPD
ncbi:MAG: NAD-dependent epimerase/dehydratase family protein [Burkholderiaceae bacterium]|jgi:dihydroflavonol-4-reductase